MAPAPSPDMPSSLPACTPLLDVAELEAAACRALHCHRSALQSLDCGNQKSGGAVDGFLSRCGSMTVAAVVQGRTHELHLFVKREDTHDVIDGLDSFQREGLFYSKVLPHLEKAWRKNQPAEEEAKLSRPDLGPAAYLGTKSVVVMEDLTRRGYSSSRDWLWDGLDYSTAQQTLRALARIHAATLLAERCNGVNLAEVVPDLMEENYFTRRPGSVGRRLVDCSFDVVRDHVLPKLFHRLQVPQTKAELQRLQDITLDISLEIDIDKVRAEDPSGVRVLSHGDTWPNNVLVKCDAEQGRVTHAVLVDFQMCRLGPPAWDVLMYLYIATKRKFREEHMNDLLSGYHADLTRFTQQRGLDISKDFSLDVFLESVRRLTRPARALRCIYAPLTAGDPKEMDSILKDTKARTALLLDSATRGSMVTRWCDESPRCTDLLLECIEELLDLPPTDSAASS